MSWEAEKKATRNAAVATIQGLSAGLVNDGRPQKLERVGQTHQREQADGGEIYALLRHPRLHNGATQ